MRILSSTWLRALSQVLVLLPLGLWAVPTLAVEIQWDFGNGTKLRCFDQGGTQYCNLSCGGFESRNFDMHLEGDVNAFWGAMAHCGIPLMDIHVTSGTTCGDPRLYLNLAEYAHFDSGIGQPVELLCQIGLRAGPTTAPMGEYPRASYRVALLRWLVLEANAPIAPTSAEASASLKSEFVGFGTVKGRFR